MEPRDISYSGEFQNTYRGKAKKSKKYCTYCDRATKFDGGLSYVYGIHQYAPSVQLPLDNLKRWRILACRPGDESRPTSVRLPYRRLGQHGENRCNRCSAEVDGTKACVWHYGPEVLPALTMKNRPGFVALATTRPEFILMDRDELESIIKLPLHKVPVEVITPRGKDLLRHLCEMFYGNDDDGEERGNEKEPASSRHENLWVVIYHDAWNVNRDSSRAAEYYVEKFADENVPCISVEIPPRTYGSARDRRCHCMRSRVDIRLGRKERHSHRRKKKQRAREWFSASLKL